MEIKIANIKNGIKVGPNHFRIDRTTPLGNPFALQISEYDSRNVVCNKYQEYFDKRIKNDKKDTPLKKQLRLIEKALKKHKLVILYCHCFPRRCHGETVRNYILEKVNK